MRPAYLWVEEEYVAPAYSSWGQDTRNMQQNPRKDMNMVMIIALAVVAIRGFILDIMNPLPNDPIRPAAAEAPPMIKIHF